MSEKTVNYQLTRLDSTEIGSLIDINSNAIKLDAALKQNHDAQQAHNESQDNPHGVTKAQVGLGNVDDTPDAAKPISTAQQTALDGKADLDSTGKVPAAQLPSFVDDVLEYPGRGDFPAVGETGKIYIDMTTNITWRWSGSMYIEVSPSLALGETPSTAYRGDKGKIAYDHVQDKSNPHMTTAAQIGAIPRSQKGADGGVADLDENGKILPAQLPSSVDSVLEHVSKTDFPHMGESEKIYIAADTDLIYRWTGSDYVEVSPSLGLGETANTAYRGDKGKQNETDISNLEALVNVLISRSTPRVGEVELNFNGVDPGTKYPGTTWVQRAQGRALVGVGNNGTNAYTARQEFGADNVALSVEQIPPHNHDVKIKSEAIFTATAGTASYRNGSGAKYTGNTGGGKAHENRQKSIALYVWERTA